ncbi:hypothetical protein [Streptomyces sp. NPDC005209]|uniref:hypothetical protein n=1 Tax=Streptomyces sp. NPDC005209 TaxID=3156715 RepID=UPI00339DBFDC
MTTLITRDELKAAIDAGTVTVVDTLGGEYCARQHLPGAARCFRRPGWSSR